MRTPQLHDLCHHVEPGQATARIPYRSGQGAEAVLNLVLTVSLHVVCAACPRQSEPFVTVFPAAVASRARAEGWRTLEGQTLCAECYTERAARLLPAAVRSRVTQPTDLSYHRGKGGNGSRGGLVVTGRVVGRTPKGDEMLEEFISVNGVVQRETIARSYLERVTMPISAEEAREENPHLFTMVKEWVRKQIYHAVDTQASAERLAEYTFYRHRTRPAHIRAAGVFIRWPDGSGVAEVFYMERRRMRRHCVGQSFLEEHFEPIAYDEALRLDKSLIVHLDQWAYRQQAVKAA